MAHAWILDDEIDAPEQEPDCPECRDSGTVSETESDHDRVQTWPCSCPVGRAVAQEAARRYAAAREIERDHFIALEMDHARTYAQRRMEWLHTEALKDNAAFDYALARQAEAIDALCARLTLTFVREREARATVARTLAEVRS
jgi:hypothetical protein